MTEESAIAPIAVVTGAASGIGAATSDKLRQHGFEVAVIDLNPPAVSQPGVMAVAADISDPEAVSAAFAEIEQQLGPVDVLVNNAGITGSQAATRLHETPMEEWDRVMAVNVRGAYLCSRAALTSMVPRRTGQIIIIASVAAVVPFPGRAAYSVSKGAALLMAKSIAVDYASDGIRANAICPGMVETPMTQWRLDRRKMRAEIEARTPMGRVAQPEEIADAVALLACDRLPFMTGHGLILDGGWTAL